MIGEVLAARLNIHYAEDVLRKTSCNPVKNTPKENRNISETIIQLKSAKRPCNVLLIDDFFSSGTTANECVRVLKKDPLITKIYYLAIAKTK